MKEELKEMKGVTLIALVITIIVLLILAGVSIAMLTGDNGLLTKAENAKAQTEIAEIKERVKTDILGEQAGNKTANISKSQLKTILDKYFTDVPEKYTLKTKIKAKAEYGSYSLKVSDLYDGKFEGGFDEDEFTLGTSESDAKNTDKYGNKVTDYNIEETETGGWRLFYQDSNYTYLITNKCIGNYNPADYYTTMKDEEVLKYQSGADVSVVGQKLNSMLDSSAFTSNNKRSNILAMAWLLDTSDTGMWSKYKNEDAVFAIGSPTIELFSASYNNRSNKSNSISLFESNTGYSFRLNGGSTLAMDNNRIYNNGTSKWWIASPYNGSSADSIYVDGTSRTLKNYFVTNNSCAIRPVVCIPTTVFNSKYTLQND